MAKPLLDVKDLHIDFSFNRQHIQAVRGVSFSLHEQETVGIVGESGCGKSTLAKALLKLTPATSRIRGEILYKGKNLASLSEKEMQIYRGAHLSMIFQDPMTSLNPTMKIGAQITEGYRLHTGALSREERRAFAVKMLDLVGIPKPQEMINTYPHTLSGGMRQRVMIALALAASPNILIADEPTTALDVTIQAQIIELLKSLQHELKMSILLITHDLSVVANCCHRVLVMYAGKVVESGPVEAIFARPRHPYTRRLLASLPRLDRGPNDPIKPIPGAPPSLTRPFVGCAFCTRCDHAFSRCQTEEPLLSTTQDNHYFACHMEDA